MRQTFESNLALWPEQKKSIERDMDILVSAFFKDGRLTYKVLKEFTKLLRKLPINPKNLDASKGIKGFDRRNPKLKLCKFLAKVLKCLKQIERGPRASIFHKLLGTAEKLTAENLETWTAIDNFLTKETGKLQPEILPYLLEFCPENQTTIWSRAVDSKSFEGKVTLCFAARGSILKAVNVWNSKYWEIVDSAHQLGYNTGWQAIIDAVEDLCCPAEYWQDILHVHTTDFRKEHLRYGARMRKETLKKRLLTQTNVPAVPHSPQLK